MNDCPNADIRDQLPDLLHDRLDMSMRAAVMAHVDACVDCRAELELLRSVHGMLVSRTPRVDIEYIVGALPKARSQPARVVARRPMWSDWRIAAAVTVLAVGGGSLAVLRQGATPSVVDTSLVAPMAVQPDAGAPGSSTGATAPPAGSTSVARIATTVGGSGAGEQGVADLPTTARLADLNERQLRALLDEIDALQAVPITEPEPVTIRLDGKATSPEGA